MPLTTQQTAEINKQYDPLRKRAQQQEGANLQQTNDAMARRYAALGGGPSGSMIKQQAVAQDQSAQRLQSANEGIDAQQQGALNQARETQAQRDYQTGERVAGQQFSHGERLGQQTFATGERVGSQQFASGESALARKLQKYGIDTQDATTRRGQGIQNDQFNATLGENKRQYDSDYTQNVLTNKINSVLSAHNSGLSGEQVADLLRSVGITDFGDIPGVTAGGMYSDDQAAVDNQASGGAEGVVDTRRQMQGGTGINAVGGGLSSGWKSNKKKLRL